MTALKSRDSLRIGATTISDLGEIAKRLRGV